MLSFPTTQKKKKGRTRDDARPRPRTVRASSEASAQALWSPETPGTVGLTALIMALVTGILPSTPFVCGVAMVFYSLTLYTR